MLQTNFSSVLCSCYVLYILDFANRKQAFPNWAMQFIETQTGEKTAPSFIQKLQNR